MAPGMRLKSALKMTTEQDRYQAAFAIIRLDIDRDMNRTSIDEVITIKEVVMTQEVAEKEVARLNLVNAGKGCRYWWQYTRLYDQGSAGSYGEPHDPGTITSGEVD